MVQRQRNEFVPIVPTPTSPRIFGRLGASHLQASVAGRCAADGVAPVLVDDRKRLAAIGIGQHDIARAAEVADRIAHTIVVVVVKAHAGCGDLLQERGLHMPVVVEALRHVELEA
jgi:hypothetical protein